MQTDTLKNTDTPKWMIKIIQLTHRQAGKKTWKENKKKQTEVLTYPWLSLSLNALNIPIQIHRLAERIKNYDPTSCYLQYIHSKYNSMGRLREKELKKYSIK